MKGKPAGQRHMKGGMKGRTAYRGTMGSGGSMGGINGTMGKHQSTGSGEGQGGGGNAHPHPPSSTNAASGGSGSMKTNKSGMKSNYT